jgi:ribosome-binding protein aMBF1 (putative translation factor)
MVLKGSQMGKNVVISTKPVSQKINNVEDFGEHIRYERTKHGTKINDLALAININSKTIGKLENGSIGSRLSTAIEVANMLGLEIIVREKDARD